MTIQVTCHTCGKVVKAKDEYAGKKGKCPGCGRIVLMPAQKIVPAEAEESQFPWLNESVPAQKTRHAEAGGTASPSRASTELPEARDSSPEPPSRKKATPEDRLFDASASDTKTCPACAEVIKAAATKCRYCGEVLVAANDEPSTQPPALPEFRTDTGFSDPPRSSGSMTHKTSTARILISAIVILVPVIIIAVLLFGISERQKEQQALEEHRHRMDMLRRQGEDDLEKIRKAFR